MSGEFDISGGVMKITKDGRIVLDTSLPLMNLIPGSEIILTGHTISWPNLWQGTIYHQMRDSSGPFEMLGCASFAGLIAQEWGPSETNVLTDEVLGTVPSGTDYLDVMVKLSRTTNPAGWFDLPMYANLPTNEWVKLEGGSCLIEGFYNFRRMFEIILNGTDVILRRYQSVGSNGQVTRNSIVSTGNATSYVAGTNAPTNGSLTATYGATKQTKSSVFSPNHWPPNNPSSSDPCQTSALDYASTWTGDIRITPGRISA